MSKPKLIQQNITTKAIKTSSSYEDDENENDIYINSYNNKPTPNETMLLAQFLATTGPEEYEPVTVKKQQQFKSALRIFNKIRKNAVGNVPRSAPKLPGERKKHIPLPVHEILNNNIIQEKSTIKPDPIITSAATLSQQIDSSTRDSGIYSDTNSEKETTTAYSPVAPVQPLTSVLNDLRFPQPPAQYINLSPKSSSYYRNSDHCPSRPAPLPPTAISAATSSAYSPTSYSTLSSPSELSSNNKRVRSIPEAALNRRSARLRHVQVQTQTDILSKKPSVCLNCQNRITKEGRVRTLSCPPSLASGPTLLTSKESEDSKMLLSMIMKLKTQLEEEKQCRIRLEKAMNLQQSDEKKIQLAFEKEKWVSGSLWLHDRIALLPESK